MEYRRLGKYGLKVSELSLGAWVTFGGQVGGLDNFDLAQLGAGLGGKGDVAIGDDLHARSGPWAMPVSCRWPVETFTKDRHDL